MRNFKSILLRTGVVLILCIALLLSSTVMPLAAGLAGDINADDTLTAEDLTIIRKSLLNGESVSEYDVNGDGKFNLRDLVNLKKKLAYYVDSEKFTANSVTEIGNADAVKITELFTVMEGVKIDSSLVSINVNTDNSDVIYEINANTENWENSTILFKGIGEVTVTIREYCRKTSITLNVVNEVKFDVAESLPDVFGNATDTTVGALFELKDGYTVSADMKVTAENVSGNASAVIGEIDITDWQNTVIDFSGTGIVRVTIIDNSEPTFVEVVVDDEVKFDENKNSADTYGNASVITVGTLFEARDGYSIDSTKVKVTATPNDGDVTCEIVLDADNWENGKLEFDGTGSITLTIIEESKPTSVTVTVVDADKFELKVGDPYTVKNTENVVLGDIFAELTGVDVDSDKVEVNISKLNEEDTVNWSFTENKNDWTSGVIDFSGKGQVTVTIEEDSNPTTLAIIVEPIDKFVAIEGVWVEEGTTVKLGELFNVIDGVAVDSSMVTVTVDNGEYTKDDKDWKNGTIKFTTVGTVTVTIEEDSVVADTTVEVKEITPIKKFDIKFPNAENYTYRVGNKNAISLNSLFKAAWDVTIGNATVTVTSVDGSDVSGKFTANNNWTEATVKLSGTGIAKITIQDDYHCIPTELTVEVIDAVNATSAIHATANDVVLLNDMSLSPITISGGYTLHGNGFTLTAASDVTGDSMNTAYVEMKNGRIDNVRVICPDFSHQIMYMSQAKENGNVDPSAEWRYKNIRSAVSMNGNNIISNSYISGGRAGVYVLSGYATIDNTTVKAGALANIHIGAAQSVTLRDITLIQKPTKATVNETSKTKMGFSIVVTCNGDGTSTPITLDGTLNQYAWANGSYSEYFPNKADTIVDYVLEQNDYKHNFSLHEGEEAQDWLCLGIAYMPMDIGYSVSQPTINDTRISEDKNSKPYGWVKISALGTEAYVYSYKNANGTDEALKTEPVYTAPDAGFILLPTLSFNDVKDGIGFSSAYDAQNGWTYTFEADLDTLGNYSFKFANLVAAKNGKALTYTVKAADGSAIDSTKEILLSDSNVTNYTLCVTDNDGVTVHEIAFVIVSKRSAINPPEKIAEPGGTSLLVVKNKDSDWSCAVPALEGTVVKYYSVAEKAYKEIALSTLTPTSTGKQNDTKNYWEYTAANSDFTLKVTCGYIHSGNQIYGMPVVVNNGGNKMYFTISSTSGYVGTSTTSRTVTLSYEFKDNNGGTLTFSKEWNCNRQDMINGGSKQYSYSDFVAGNLKEASESCLTEGTMITMADGSQKAVEDLKVGDMLLIFNHVTGKYEAAPLIFNTHVNENEATLRKVLYLQFSDGREVKIVQSHGLFDMTLMKYVYVDYSNYEDFIGHEFYTLEGNGVVLTKAFIREEKIRIFCPVTYFHMNSFANGLLNTPNIPGDITGLVNYFEYDSDLKYNEAAMKRDIEKYGLYTYADFSDYISEAAYNSSPSVYLKVAVGKGMITYEQIIDVIKYLLEGSLIQ